MGRTVELETNHAPQRTSSPLVLTNFAPTFCPSCATRTELDQHLLLRNEFERRRTFTCPACSTLIQYVETERLLATANLDGGDLRETLDECRSESRG